MGVGRHEAGTPEDGIGDDPERAALLERGRLLFARDCAFLVSAPTIKTLPPIGLPEVAFAGRSNVGKSSLLNALVGRKGLARTSNTPGRTQALNFFALGGAMMLVDLPGYGYAAAPKHKVADWTETVFAYLKGRPTLRRACLLIDSRHGILKADRAAMDVLDKSAVVYQIVMTKADKLTARQLATTLQAVKAEAAKHTACHPEVLVTSSVDATGIEALRAALASLAAEEPA
ncbi:MAG: YihA family ribosome biogenesis GTP-binding protein [Alphaproteobacteria bacterium]|nr:YihA family ribosome biogenesis GTP-binding protein [Alphaproteobacteria bacterium]